VVLTSALGNEHYEISAYEGLIIPLETMGVPDAVKLLRANLDQEVHTSEELRGMLEKVVG
jgi:ferritin-like metal-binding protein YciE